MKRRRRDGEPVNPSRESPKAARGKGDPSQPPRDETKSQGGWEAGRRLSPGGGFHPRGGGGTDHEAALPS